MESGEKLQAVRSWAEQSLFLLRKLLPLASPIAHHDGWAGDELVTLGYLLTACARASESGLLLVAFGQFWDAEILVRSVTEGSLKFCYLLQSRDAFKQRYREYSHDLFRIALFKDHAKALEVLSCVPDPDSVGWKPFRDRLLSDEELEEFRVAYPPALRRDLEGRWGFARLMGTLSQPGEGQLVGVGGLAHGYALSSHVHHMDYIGASLPFDHASRPPDRRDAIESAHAIRLISDVFTFLVTRLIVGYRFVRCDPQPILEARQEIAALQAGLR